MILPFCPCMVFLWVCVRVCRLGVLMGGGSETGKASAGVCIARRNFGTLDFRVGSPYLTGSLHRAKNSTGKTDHMQTFCVQNSSPISHLPCIHYKGDERKTCCALRCAWLALVLVSISLKRPSTVGVWHRRKKFAKWNFPANGSGSCWGGVGDLGIGKWRTVTKSYRAPCVASSLLCLCVVKIFLNKRQAASWVCCCRGWCWEIVFFSFVLCCVFAVAPCIGAIEFSKIKFLETILAKCIPFRRRKLKRYVRREGIGIFAARHMVYLCLGIVVER